MIIVVAGVIRAPLIGDKKIRRECVKRLEALEVIRQSNLRPTKARVLILAELTGNTRHPTPDDLLRTFREQDTPFSPATLYQNLNKLAEEGLVRCIVGVDDRMHFDANLEPHHHLVCLECGRLTDVSFDVPIQEHLCHPFGDAQETLGQWHLQPDWWLIKGVCPKCLAAVRGQDACRLIS